jgi:hypothetical protein
MKSEFKLGGNALDLTGHIYGRLTCLEPVGRNKFGQVIWRCECACGTTIERHAAELRKPKRVDPSCGCAMREHARRMGAANALDLTGQQFGKLTVVERAGSNAGQSATWLCRCECGRETATATTAALRNGNTTSCGKCIDYRTWWEADPTYDSVHQRLRTWRGRASTHSCVTCGKPADEWAYHHGSQGERVNDQGIAFSADLNAYDPMCRSCHRQMDFDRTWADRARRRATRVVP